MAFGGCGVGSEVRQSPESSHKAQPAFHVTHLRYILPLFPTFETINFRPSRPPEVPSGAISNLSRDEFCLLLVTDFSLWDFRWLFDTVSCFPEPEGLCVRREADLSADCLLPCVGALGDTRLRFASFTSLVALGEVGDTCWGGGGYRFAVREVPCEPLSSRLALREGSMTSIVARQSRYDLVLLKQSVCAERR